MLVLDWSNLGVAVNCLSSFQHFLNVCILEGIYSEIIQRKTYIFNGTIYSPNDPVCKHYPLDV
jgi:hypothetical protein